MARALANRVARLEAPKTPPRYVAPIVEVDTMAGEACDEAVARFVAEHGRNLRRNQSLLVVPPARPT